MTDLEMDLLITDAENKRLKEENERLKHILTAAINYIIYGKRILEGDADG